MEHVKIVGKKMSIKKIVLIILLIILVGSSLFFIIYLGNRYKHEDSNKIEIIVSNYASYDFIRQIVGDIGYINITFLVGPGKESHGYDPTAKDIIKIENSDLFVYIGGELEPWADKIISSLKLDKAKAICILDLVEKEEDLQVDGAAGDEHEEDGAFNEHVWTSPKNAKQMVLGLEKSLEKLDPDKSEIYLENANNYIAKIDEVDSKIRNVIDNKVRSRLVFGDKMPMQYFVSYYNLKVSAAFNGCSSEMEPSSKTIAYLANLVKIENIPVILYTELNDGRIAKLIADEAGGKVEILKLQTLHNISLEDFENGESWVSLMTRNIEVLKKALT